MTRNPPQGQYGYGGQQFGEEQSYGNYPGQNPSGEYQQPQPGYGYNRGPPQSYYGSNNEAYQQYPSERPPQEYGQGGYQGEYQNQQYGEQSYSRPPPGPPPQHQQSGHGEGYPPSYTQGGDVDSFRFQFDHPNAPPNEYGHYGQVPADQYPPTGAPPGPEGDRGIMGALAGGAAGAWGGHKVHHGILGGIGGAVAGSMLEDAYKHHKQEERRHGSRRGSHDSDSSRHHQHGGAPAGNFHASSRDVYLEGRCILVAECANSHGHHHRSTLDLNDCLTNTNGSLHWARGGNFAASSRDIRLKHNGRILEAELGDGCGGWRHNEIDLNEMITNEDGRLQMI